MADASGTGLDAARAILETFYCAINTADIRLLREVWLDDPLTQLTLPNRPALRGRAAIAGWYRSMLDGSRGLVLDVADPVEIGMGTVLIFSAREYGTYCTAADLVSLNQRATYCCAYNAAAGGWRLVHGHVSIHEPIQLLLFQRAAAAATSLGLPRSTSFVGIPPEYQ